MASGKSEPFELLSGSGYMAMKFPNGLMIEAVRTSSYFSVSSAGTSTVRALGNWPVAFTEKPVISASLDTSHQAWIDYWYNTSATYIGEMSVARQGSAEFSSDICIIGIGKWK